MKTIFNSLLVLIAAAGLSTAATLTVTLTPASGLSCSFTATEVTQDITNNGTFTGAGKGTLQPIAITEAADTCLPQLVVHTFSSVPTVTITLTNVVSGVTQTVFRYTLTDVFVTNLTQTQLTQNFQKVAMNLYYFAIKVEDLVSNTTYTCSAVTNTCS